MSRPKKIKYFMGDFETTVYEGQDYTEVWASAVVELFSEDVKIFHSIGETYDFLIEQNCNIIIYYHNLKFDGSFWLSHFLSNGFKEAFSIADEEFIKDAAMPNRSFKYLISDMGEWYSVTLKINNHTIEFRDSFKLLPFSVEKIGKSFKTKHKKLNMDYKGFRYAGCKISEEEKEYIANDVLVVKEALEIMFNEGHKKLTIGSCCLAEFQRLTGMNEFKNIFPDLTKYELNPKIYGSENVDSYIRKSYKGGYCYVVKGKENKVFHDGLTADVNSLYPSMMSSESGNKYPYGKPTFWRGDHIPDQALDDRCYFFIRIKTRFYIKKDYLPCIQIKRNLRYKATQWLETSDIYNPKDGKYYKHYIDLDGNVQPAEVILTLTMTDFYLIKEHYDLVDFEILDGCWFWAVKGLFDEYIEKYKKIKMESTGAVRELAKLFLNNLYGKMATNNNSSFKRVFLDPTGALAFRTTPQFNKPVGFIAVGSAITSYARNFTIRTAQKNYYGKDKAGFIYADTDSIHCDLKPEELKGVTVDPIKFCCWKLEGHWKEGIFVRQKTYIEYITHEDGNAVDPYYNIKCAGMPKKCKNLLNLSFNWTGRHEWETQRPEEFAEFTEEEKDFILEPRNITDFKSGLIVPSKLLPKQIKGGIVLMETTFEMR